ncbi:MAG: S9 family peptidase [Calditrichaeota bacterium]|nr:S9 family peptidase [Calditrichota bacterium]MCB9391084.1 S9 family peptidase [Calditrichota bacterium]
MKRQLLVLSILLTAIATANASDFTLSQFLNVQYAQRPTFNPTATELAYISNVSGEPQVWRVVGRMGKLIQTTFEPDGMDGVWWSPASSNQMVVSASRGGSERSKLYMLDPNVSPLMPLTPTEDDAIYRFGCWSQDGTKLSYVSNARNGVDFDVYEHSITESEPRMVFSGGGSLSAECYSQDNRFLVITRDHSNVNSDILLYDRTTGETRVLTEHVGDELFSNPHFDDTSTKLFALSNRGREYSGVCSINIFGGELTWIETPEMDIDLLAVSSDGLNYAYSANDRGLSRFNFVDIRHDRRVGSFRLPDGIIRGMTFSNDGKRLAMTFGAADRPFDVWIYDAVNDLLSPVSSSATGGIPTDLFVKPELIEYDSFDKLKVPAFWYTPKDAKGKLPVVIAIHGGPESQARPDLSGWFQYLLHNGYAILEPNVRGSSGFGKSYMSLDNVHKRMDSVKDIEYAAKWLAKQKNVDKSKIVLYGGSYGGFMVLSGLTTYPDLFAAGIDVVGISNFVSFLENTGKYRRALREAEYGSLETDREFLESVSPLNQVDKIRAPLFVIQGANDPRVPQSESDQMVEAIRTRGGIAEYLVFEDEGHGLSKIENRIEAYDKVVEFLNTHVRK